MFRECIRIFLLVCVAGIAFGQHYTTPFGQSRIQYKKFDWYFYSTNNFDIYYYPGGQEYALEAIDFLEEEFVNLTDRLGYAPYNKIKILIYNSIYDLQQSNIGIDGAVYTIGGRTDFVKLQVEVAYPGKANQFKQDLLYKLSGTLIQDMMYGGSLVDIFQNSYLLTLPEWFIDGAARYVAYGWSREMDDYIRDYMGRKKIRKLKRIEKKSAGVVGQSIWNYLANEYGESNISNILNLTRITRKEENSIANTLGVSFKSFLGDWQVYYLLQREEVLENYDPPDEENIIAKLKNNESLIKSSVRLSKDADKVAYTTLKRGKYRVFVEELETGETKKITAGGFRINGQAIDDHLPLLDWKDEFTVGVILFKRGFLFLNTYNLETGEKSQKPLNRFGQVESFSFNDNGRLAVISGDIDGQNDLFLISMRRNALRRITRDVYDDLDPVFVPGTSAIVFSSNRTTDSVKVGRTSLESLDNNFNLFVYHLDTTTTNFFRLTNTYSEDRKPYVKNENEIYYLSDQKGISNLFRYNLRRSTLEQVTKYDKNIISYDLHFDPDVISYIMLYKGKEQVYLEENIDLNASTFTPDTPKKQKENEMMVVSKALDEGKKTGEAENEEGMPSAIARESLETEGFGFEGEEEENPEETPPEWIDTDNYLFEYENEAEHQPESFFSKYRNLEREEERVGPIPYEPRFTFNNVITSFLWDPYRNFMIFMESEINDILENYKVKGGLLTSTNFRQGDLFAEFQYLKYWVDFKFRIDKKTYLLDNPNLDNNLLHKYKLSSAGLKAALPLAHTFRTEVFSFFTSTSFTNLDFMAVQGNGTDLAQNSRNNYYGAGASLIFDNTVEKEFNLYQGTRILLEHTAHFNGENPNLNFSNLKLDFRHYQKVHRQITWANRIFYGKFMGPAAKSYLLGGVNNWLFAKSQSQGLADPLEITSNKDNSDILFNEFVTNLRGLDYNEANGQETLLFNTELRVPVFQYFSNNPIKSNFLRNFQITTFFDMGSVWTGKPPLVNGRSITRKFDGMNSQGQSGAFTAEIVKFQNPWLGGFGIGVRTVLFGYYIKVDMARPYIDGNVGNYRFYFSLGLDF